jgi:hypothetical protein
MAAFAHGWAAVVLTITMIVLATGMLAGIKRVTLHWPDHYGDALAGGGIVSTGVAMVILGS